MADQPDNAHVVYIYYNEYWNYDNDLIEEVCYVSDKLIAPNNLPINIKQEVDSVQVWVNGAIYSETVKRADGEWFKDIEYKPK